jgi:hypothetical protein
MAVATSHQESTARGVGDAEALRHQNRWIVGIVMNEAVKPGAIICGLQGRERYRHVFALDELAA